MIAVIFFMEKFAFVVLLLANDMNDVSSLFTDFKLLFHFQITCVNMHRAKHALKNVCSLASLAYQAQRSGTMKVNHLSQSPNVLRYFSTSVAAEPFLNGSSSIYVEEMYNSWLGDPKSVHKVLIDINSLTDVLLVGNLANLRTNTKQI